MNTPNYYDLIYDLVIVAISVTIAVAITIRRRARKEEEQSEQDARRRQEILAYAQETFLAAMEAAGLDHPQEIIVRRGIDGLWDCQAFDRSEETIARGEYSHPGRIWLTLLVRPDGTRLQSAYWWPNVPPWPAD